jgi:hypothetical protein
MEVLACYKTETVRLTGNSYWLSMSSVGITNPGAAASFPFFTGSQPAFLDSGTTLSYLPAAIIAPIVKTTGARPHQTGSSQYVVHCSLMNQAGSVPFGFGNRTIQRAIQIVHLASWNR